MGVIEDKLKAAAYDAAKAQESANMHRAEGANAVLTQAAQERAVQEALAMQEMLKQPGMAAALTGPQYAANDINKRYEELGKYQQYLDSVQPTYGASVAPTGNIGQNGARLAPQDGTQAGLADAATNAWREAMKARKAAQ